MANGSVRLPVSFVIVALAPFALMVMFLANEWRGVPKAVHSDPSAWTAARSENCAMRASDLAYAVDPRFWSRERSRKVYEECMGE